MSRDRGFTLIELLIVAAMVAAIIGITVSIIIPGLPTAVAEQDPTPQAPTPEATPASPPKFVSLGEFSEGWERVYIVCDVERENLIYMSSGDGPATLFVIAGGCKQK